MPHRAMFLAPCAGFDKRHQKALYALRRQNRSSTTFALPRGHPKRPKPPSSVFLALPTMKCVNIWPCLLRLFSVVTLLSHQLVHKQAPAETLPVRQIVWYHKIQPTFASTLGWGHCLVWQHAQLTFPMSHFQHDREKLQNALLHRMTDLLCYLPDG